MNLRGMAGHGILQLIAGHATSVVMAGLFGFFAILATRGVCSASWSANADSGESRAGCRAALVVCMVTALLLAPTVRKTVVRDWVAGAMPARWPARPVLWYLGVNETLAGHIVAETPVVLPPRFSFVAFPRQQDDAGRAAYRMLRRGLPRSRNERGCRCRWSRVSRSPRSSGTIAVFPSRSPAAVPDRASARAFAEWPNG